MDNLASNIKVLREEARLSQIEFAARAGVDLETVQAWETGAKRPLTKDLMIICPILRIHEEDILERDILAERIEANKKLKQSKVRNDYDWYYGSRKKILFYALAIVLIVLASLLTYLYVTNFGYFDTMINELIAEGVSLNEISITLRYYYIWYPALAASVVTLIFIGIELSKRVRIRWNPWYVLFIIPMISFGVMLGTLIVVPYIFYALYMLIIKRGKN